MAIGGRVSARFVAQRSWATTLLIVLAGLFSAAAWPIPTRAQNVGWCGTLSGCAPTPMQAAQMVVALGYPYYSFQDLTPALNTAGTGIDPSQMTVWYTAVGTPTNTAIYYYCPGTNAVMPPQGCPSGPPPCYCNNGGNPAPTTPKPIDILSGNESLTATDFANASGTLKLTRVFASATEVGVSSWRASVATAPLASPIGLGNWLYDFQFELHISGTAPNSPVLLLTPGGGAPAFTQNSGAPTSLILVSYTGSLPPNPQTDYALSIKGYTPSGGSFTVGWPTNLTAQSTTWTLTDGNDTVYTLTGLPPLKWSIPYVGPRTILEGWNDGKEAPQAGRDRRQAASG